MKGSRCHSRAIALLLLLLSLTSLAWSQANTWTFKAHMLHTRANAAAATGPDGRIYVFGGDDSSTSLDSAEAYDPNTDSWTAIATMPEPREGHLAVAGPDGLIYIIAGFKGITNVSSVYAYDPVLNTYSPRADALFTGKAAGALGPDGIIYCFRDGHVYLYNIAANSWSQAADSDPGLKPFSTATSDPDGNIYLSGGSFGNAQKEAFLFDGHADAWIPLDDMTAPRYTHGMAFGGDHRVYAAGGSSADVFTSTNTAEAFDPASGHWSAIPSMHTKRSTPACAVDNQGRIYVFGGYEEDNIAAPLQYFDTVECFQPPLLRATGENIQAVEGAEFTGVVATLTDIGTGHTSVNFTASIDWSDGSAPTVGSVTDGATPGTYEVTGTHTYAEEGTYITGITITDSDGETAFTTGVAQVADAPLNATKTDFSAFSSVAFTGEVGRFTDGNPLAAKSDFTVSIDWGDGLTLPGTVSDDGSGGFIVKGTYTYVFLGEYHLTVTITDTDGGATAVVHPTASVTWPPPTVTGTTITGTEGASFSGQVATFTDADPTLVATNFTASIDWGDGHTSSGAIVSNGSGFNVSGNHTYEEEGEYIVVVTVTPTNGPSSSGTGAANIADASLTAHGFDLICKGTKFSDTVAAFTDADPHGVVGDYTAAIFWGDGKSSNGTIVKAGSGFKVVGTHSYLKRGKYTVIITIRDEGGSIASATTHINAGPVK